MNVPWLCNSCGRTNLVDLFRLEEIPMDRITSMRGFTCAYCRDFQVISYSSLTVRDAEKKLSRYTPKHEQYQFMIQKLIRKLRGMREKFT